MANLWNVGKLKGDERIVVPVLEIDPRSRPVVTGHPGGRIRRLAVTPWRRDHTEPHRRLRQSREDRGTQRQTFPGLWCREAPGKRVVVTLKCRHPGRT